MCGSVEYGKCEVCGKEGPLTRTYYRYPISCECHNNYHVIMIRHHNDCTPIEPEYTKIEVKTEELKNPLFLVAKIVTDLAGLKSDLKFVSDKNYRQLSKDILTYAIKDNTPYNQEKSETEAEKFLNELLQMSQYIRNTFESRPHNE